MPKNEIYDPSLNDINMENNDILNDSNNSNKKKENRKNKKNYQKKSTKNLNNDISINNINMSDGNNTNINENNDKEGNQEKTKEDKKELEFNIVKIPKLHPYNPYLDKYHSRRFNKYRPKNLWDPEIDADFLAYINHNIICIEDIYNKDKNKKINIDNSREEEIQPIEAKEILYDNNSNNLSDSNPNNSNDIENKNDKKNRSMDNSQKKDLSNIQEEEDNENRTKNKFCEFKDRHPNLIEISLSVDPTKQRQNLFKNNFFSRSR